MFGEETLPPADSKRGMVIIRMFGTQVPGILVAGLDNDDLRGFPCLEVGKQMFIAFKIAAEHFGRDQAGIQHKKRQAVWNTPAS